MTQQKKVVLAVCLFSIVLLGCSRTTFREKPFRFDSARPPKELIGQYVIFSKPVQLFTEEEVADRELEELSGIRIVVSKKDEKFPDGSLTIEFIARKTRIKRPLFLKKQKNGYFLVTVPELKTKKDKWNPKNVSGYNVALIRKFKQGWEIRFLKDEFFGKKIKSKEFKGRIKKFEDDLLDGLDNEFSKEDSALEDYLVEESTKKLNIFFGQTPIDRVFSKIETRLVRIKSSEK